MDAFRESPEATTNIEELKERGLSYETPEFYFHMRLFDDQGFIERDDAEPGIGVDRGMDGTYCWSVLPLRLTASGQEFAEVMANNTAFEAVKMSSVSPSLGMTRDIAVAVLKAESPGRTHSAPERDHGTKVFIGHGGSHVWLALKNFLTARLGLDCDEFNAESVAGVSTTERLQVMLDRAVFAFLVMTAEDRHADGAAHARENVIHEAGLFQGRLGFERAIILLEEGCSQFSNIHGLTTIRFPKGNIEPASEQIRGVLEREGVTSSRDKPAYGPDQHQRDTESRELVARREAADYIPHMTENERKIIAYLLAHNQKMFTNTPDCGHATTLLSRGIVVNAARPGQIVTHYEVPFAIPNHIWTVLKQHEGEFPYTPPAPGETETHPWRVHWMER